MESPTSVAVYCREICREPRYESEASGIFGSDRKADEFLEGIDFELSREPTAHSIQLAGGIRAVKTIDKPAWPAVVVYFLIEDHKVTLLSIRRCE